MSVIQRATSKVTKAWLSTDVLPEITPTTSAEMGAMLPYWVTPISRISVPTFTFRSRATFEPSTTCSSLLSASSQRPVVISERGSRISSYQRADEPVSTALSSPISSVAETMTPDLSIGAARATPGTSIKRASSGPLSAMFSCRGASCSRSAKVVVITRMGP